MEVFNTAKWIWVTPSAGADEYGEFTDTFSASRGASIRISCDGDYALWVNGTFAASNQYGDYEHYKIYDTVDLTPYLTPGENRIAVLCWHFGIATMRYKPATAGLIYEIFSGEQILAVSDEATKARLSNTYQNGRKKKITGQLGLGFAYDATKEDAWQTEEAEGFSSAIPVEKTCVFYPRPIEKHQLWDTVWGTVIRREKNRILLDLGKETVGLFSVALESPCEQNTLITFGEHLDDDGWVPRLIGRRDFSIEYRAKKGENRYVSPMLRFGCRFLEIQSEAEVELQAAGVIPQRYPVTERKVSFENPLDKRIYDLCVNTLNQCMMEHYVDCPWREQCLYAFDSRNQMLCGYKVFEDGNFNYARANLLLMSKDPREGGLLSICFPSGGNLTIPSFSLYYIVAVREYLDASGDATLIDEVYPRLTGIIQAFVNNRRDGLAVRFERADHWNFYDWSPHSSGTLGKTEAVEADAAINCILILAMNSLCAICEKTGRSFPFEQEREELKINTRKAFFVTEKGLMTMRAGTDEYTDLVNCLAVLTDVVTEEDALKICDAVRDGETVPCSLSMRVFKYDAWIKTDKERYMPSILEEIRRDYKTMLDSGYDCAWETVVGHPDFDRAGSLCHGWSAVPVLYLPQAE